MTAVKRLGRVGCDVVLGLFPDPSDAFVFLEGACAHAMCEVCKIDGEMHPVSHLQRCLGSCIEIREEKFIVVHI